MIKIMMHGCNGKMGRMITEIVKNDENAVITAGVDTYTETPNVIRYLIRWKNVRKTQML